MSNKSATERAEFLSQMAPNPSVTTAVLADDEPEFVESRLAGDPPVTYLEDSEAPAFVLTNKKRGMAAGGKHNQTKPDSGRGAVALVTGRRTLCLVGADPDDKALEIPHTDVAKVSTHTGFLSKRLEIRTTRRVYHCWVSRSTDTAILEDAAAYIDDRAGGDPAELEPEEMPSSDSGEQFTYRGKVVTKPGDSTGQEDEPDDSTATATDDGGGAESSDDGPPTEQTADGTVAESTTDGGTVEASDRPTEMPASDPDGRVCPGCGESLATDVNFCPTCGEPVSDGDSSETDAETDEADTDETIEGDTGSEDETGSENDTGDDNTVMYRGREVDASYLK
jgi:hypothetical protein